MGNNPPQKAVRSNNGGVFIGSQFYSESTRLEREGWVVFSFCIDAVHKFIETLLQKIEEKKKEIQDMEEEINKHREEILSHADTLLEKYPGD